MMIPSHQSAGTIPEHQTDEQLMECSTYTTDCTFQKFCRDAIHSGCTTIH